MQEQSPDNTASNEVVSPEAKLAASLKEFQKLSDPKLRKAYFDTHPELRRIYSEGNFHVA